MSDAKRFSLVAGAAVFCALAVLAGGTFWVLGEQRHAEEWRAEVARQKAFADSALKHLTQQRDKLNDLKTELAIQKAAGEALAGELRNELALQTAILQTLSNKMATGVTPGVTTLTPLPILDLPGGFVPQGVALKGRAWGPEQATGAPDTAVAGDQQTAWASLTQDGQPEWLTLDYAEAVNITKVKVYETFNPGALVKVTVFDAKGNEIEVWQGKDPTAVGAGMGVSEIPLAEPRNAKRVKIYLDSVNLPGWNEIDAVGIVDDAGKTHWAVGATASSTYAEPNIAINPVKPPKAPNADNGVFNIF